MENNQEEIRILRNEYARNWRRNNPDKVKATNERFYKKLKLKKLQENRKGDKNETN